MELSPGTTGMKVFFSIPAKCPRCLSDMFIYTQLVSITMTVRCRCGCVYDIDGAAEASRYPKRQVNHE